MDHATTDGHNNSDIISLLISIFFMLLMILRHTKTFSEHFSVVFLQT